VILDMNKIKQIIQILTGCIIVVGFIYASSDRDENQMEGRDVLLKNYAKKDQDIKDTLAFYEALNEISQKGHEKESKGPEVIMHRLKPEDGKEGYYRIGDCFLTASVDVDADKKKEKICLRYLKYKEYDDIYTYVSLVLDIFKNKKQILRQELNRGYFFEERFVAFKDIDMDGKAELITKVRFSPDCSGCTAYRIYVFKEGGFEIALNLFNIDPNNPCLKNVLAKVSDFEGIILTEYKKRTKTEHPCGFYQGCVESIPWIVDSDHDGQIEVILPVRAPEDTDPFSGKTYNIFIAKFTKDGKLTGYKFQKIDYKCYSWACGVDVLGFLETNDKRTHLLINYGYPGNSPTVPELNIFDIHSNYIKNIGKFDGFYEDAIVERLRDIDGDGNTEIIYVEDTYWPPGKSHAYIVPIYGIAEYRGGRYVDANEKFKSFRNGLNQFKKK
jgi:hypothetical protein